MTVTDNIKMVVTHDRQERQPITAPTRNWRFSASYDSFVVAQTFVLRMNICGKNRQLLVAANRYGQAWLTRQEKQRTDIYEKTYNNSDIFTFYSYLFWTE